MRKRRKKKVSHEGRILKQSHPNMLIWMWGFSHKRDASSNLRIGGKESEMSNGYYTSLMKERDHSKICQNNNNHRINPRMTQ